MVFNSRQGVMRHKKLRHIEEVMECPRFLEDQCGYSNEYCWNKHTSKKHVKNFHVGDESISNLGFHRDSVNLDAPEHRN